MSVSEMRDLLYVDKPAPSGLRSLKKTSNISNSGGHQPCFTPGAFFTVGSGI